MVSFENTIGFAPILGMSASGSRATTALDSAYVYGVAGDAIGVRFIAPRAVSVTDAYFFLTTRTGAPGNLLVEHRNAGAASSRPGSTLHASQSTASPASANKWHKSTIALPYTMTAGELYWMVLADTAGSAGNNFTACGRSVTLAMDFASYLFVGSTSSNGFTTGSIYTQPAPVVLKLSDGTYFGHPYTNLAGDTNNTRKRGHKITNLGADYPLVGLGMNVTANVSGLEVFDESTGPGGTPIATRTFDSDAVAAACVTFSEILLKRGYTYRVVLTFSANSTGPGYFVIEDYATYNELANAGLGGGQIIHTIDDGAGGWTDSPDKLCRCSLIPADFRGKPFGRAA